MQRIRQTALAVGFAVLGACAGDGTGPGGGPGPGGGGSPTLSGDVQPILTASCAFSGCHGGASPAQGMSLVAGQTFANTVNVPANELASMDRIEPNQPDQSYLVRKIEGTQAAAGGSGARMPLGGAALSQSDIDTIRGWISAGALSN